jgi:hypothetical protein
MRRLLILSAALPLLLLTACDTFVEEVDTPKDSAPYGQLNSPQDIRFLATGVQTQGANATDFLTLTSGLLSDQFRFGKNSDASFPTYAAPDRGLPTPQNTTVGDATRALGEYRRLADSLVSAADRPDSYGDDPPITKQRAKFIGTLHGAMARYYYATYTGLNPREGGGVLDQSEFIPSPEMYDRARQKFNDALDIAPTPRDEKIVRSLHARSALYAGTQFGANTAGYNDALQRAAELAQDGLKAGDSPFNAQYSVQSPNEWRQQAGPARYQVVAMDNQLNRSVVAPDGGNTHKDLSTIRSIPDVIANNSAEAARLPVTSIPFGESGTEYGQVKYEVETTPIPYISWEEMNLIRAELELRGEDAGSKSALALVNEVRADGTLPGTGEGDLTGLDRDAPFGLSALSSVDLATVAQERDRTLFGQGQRLPDQRRLDVVDWHLVDTFQGQTTWQYLPITSQERDNNPNL